MNYLTKLFMLTIFAQGVYVNDVTAKDAGADAIQPDNIQTAIHNAIEKQANSFKGSEKDLVGFLKNIKKDLDEILKSAPAEYKDLKNAIGQLDPNNLLTMLGHVNVILKNIKPETKALILSLIPLKFKPFVG